MRGELSGVPDQLQLKVSGTKDVLDLVADSKDPSAFNEAAKKLGQTVVIEGVMIPAKDLRARVPLQIGRVIYDFLVGFRGGEEDTHGRASAKTVQPAVSDSTRQLADNVAQT